MSSKLEILAKVRRNAPPPIALPQVNADWITYSDRVNQFSQVLTFVGGASQVIEHRGLAKLAIEALPAFQSAKEIVCTAKDLGLGNRDLGQVADPHELAHVDLAIVEGEFGVAENAAVWIDGAKIRHRVLLFLAQHLVLIVDANKIFDNLHQAYEQLTVASPMFNQTGYGIFVSGPSKTADIEQSLVIGAHGARSLTVLLTKN